MNLETKIRIQKFKREIRNSECCFWNTYFITTFFFVALPKFSRHISSNKILLLINIANERAEDEIH